MGLEKVLSISLIGVQLVFEIASLVLMYIANDNEKTSFLYNFNATLNNKPIMDIKEINEGSELVIDKWKGNVQGSYYAFTDSINRDVCLQNKRNKKHFCIAIHSSNDINITKWKGKKLFTSLIDDFYTYSSLFNNSVSNGNECNEGKKKCEYLDTMNNIMCISKEKECPINLILLSSSSQPPSEYQYTFSRIQFNDGNYLYYTNEAINNHILYRFKISDKDVCFVQNEYNSPYEPYILDHYDHYGCKSSINTTHSNYKYIDSINKYSLYESNNIIPSLEKLTNYPLNELKNQLTSLYYSTFIGYDKECLKKNNINIFEDKQYESKMKIINTLYTILIYMLFAAIAGIIVLGVF